MSKSEDMFVDPIGKTVHYWSGGDAVRYAKILSQAKQIKKQNLHGCIYSGDNETVFLAEKPDGDLVLLVPKFYYGNKHPIGKFLYVNWELVFNVEIKKGEKYAWKTRYDETGYELSNE